MPTPEINTQQKTADYKCGDKIFILQDGKITETRINAKTTHERWNGALTQTTYEWKVDGIEKYVQPEVDFFKTKDDLVKSLG